MTIIPIIDVSIVSSTRAVGKPGIAGGKVDALALDPPIPDMAIPGPAGHQLLVPTMYN